MATGTTTVDFGAFPGSFSATKAITGQVGIVAGSKIEIVINPVDSADHSADEHRIEKKNFDFSHSNIVAGTGFTIEASYDIGLAIIDNQSRAGPTPNASCPRAWGLWNVYWVGDWT